MFPQLPNNERKCVFRVIKRFFFRNLCFLKILAICNFKFFISQKITERSVRIQHLPLSQTTFAFLFCMHIFSVKLQQQQSFHSFALSFPEKVSPKNERFTIRIVSRNVWKPAQNNQKLISLSRADRRLEFQYVENLTTVAKLFIFKRSKNSNKTRLFICFPKQDRSNAVHSRISQIFIQFHGFFRFPLGIFENFSSPSKIPRTTWQIITSSPECFSRFTHFFKTRPHFIFCSKIINWVLAVFPVN